MIFLKPNIKKLRKNHNIKGLLKALSYKEALVRSDAALTIGQIFEGYNKSPLKDEASKALVQTLADSDFIVREATVYALGHMRQVEPLIEVLNSGEKQLRIVAAKVLGWNLQNLSVIDALFIALKNDRDEEVRSNAAGSLGSIIENRKRQFDRYEENYDKKIIDVCCKVLLEALRDTPLVYSKALWALAKSKNNDVIPHLIKGLSDENGAVREMAAVGLGMVGSAVGKEGVNSLVRTVQNSNESVETRECAIRSLGSIQNDTALQALHLLHESPVADKFRTTIDYALGKYPSNKTAVAAKQQKQTGQYWAYIHKHGQLQVKEWYQGNTFIQEAPTSPNVKHFLEEPFEATSIEEAEEIAAKLLNRN